MPAKSRIALHKVTVNIRAGDWAFIAAAQPDLDTSVVIRTIISSYVDSIKEQENKQLPTSEGIEL